MKGDHGINGEKGERGADGAPGKVTKAKDWKEGVVWYDGAIVRHAGGTYQAQRDTSQPCVHADWVCLAAPGAPGANGKDGVDGRSLTIKGTYSVSEKYQALDVVTVDHTWHVARKDAPGVCPGPDWKAGPGIGRTGKPGDRGERGERGPEGESRDVIDWEVDRKNYTITPVMSDGSHGAVCSVRDLFDQFQMEIR
jgi:hypothetical protein